MFKEFCNLFLRCFATKCAYLGVAMIYVGWVGTL